MNSNISNIELKRIKQSLPFLQKLLENNESVIENGFYKKACLSIFDHSLTIEEADTLIFVDDDKRELFSRRQKFKNTIENLYDQTDLFTWRYKRNNRLHIQKPSSLKDVLRKCDFDNLWSTSGHRYGFIIPAYSAVYLESWDWTNLLFYTDKDKIKPILDIAKKSGLHLL